MEHVGREQTVEALGRTWKFGRWDRGVWADLFKFARQVLPNPVEVAFQAIEHLPAEPTNPALRAAMEAVVSKALDKAASYISVASPEMRSLLASVEGNAHLVWLLVRKHHPEVTEDEAYELFISLSRMPGRKATLDELAKKVEPPNKLSMILDLVSGKVPEGNVEASAEA